MLECMIAGSSTYAVHASNSACDVPHRALSALLQLCIACHAAISTTMTIYYVYDYERVQQGKHGVVAVCIY
jgi:hypothetical protein